MLHNRGECLPSLPGLPSLTEKGQGTHPWAPEMDIVSAVALSSLTHNVPIALPTGLRCQALAGDNLTDIPKLSPLLTRALFLGPAGAWLPCLSEQVLTKEALGPRHRDSLAGHFLR